MKKIVYCIVAFIILSLGVLGVLFAQNTKNNLSNVELYRFYGMTPLILNIHSEIGAGYADDEVLSYWSNLVQNMKYYADIDVMSYLKMVISPQTSLENYLEETSNIMNTANSFLLYLDTQKQNFVQKKSSCDDVKSIADKNFSLAVKDINPANMEKNLKLSMENEKCSVEARINYNAYERMQAQIKYYYEILNKKYDYFYNYKYDVLSLF